MALPTVAVGQVVATLSPWAEVFEEIPNAPGSYNKHYVATVSIVQGSAYMKSYPVDVLESDYNAATDPVGFINNALRPVLQQACTDLIQQICPA